MSTYNPCLYAEKCTVCIDNLCNHHNLITQIGHKGDGPVLGQLQLEMEGACGRDCEALESGLVSVLLYEKCISIYKALSPQKMGVWSPYSHLEWLLFPLPLSQDHQ